MLRLLFISAFSIISNFLFAQVSIQHIPAILESNKSSLGLDALDSLEYAISDTYTTTHLGVTHIYLQQRHHDIPVYNGILNLNLMGKRLMSFGNRWFTDIGTRAPSHLPWITAQAAVEISASHLGRSFTDGVEIRREQNKFGQDIKVVFAPGNLSSEDIIAELVWLKGDGKEILLCWMVEIHATDTEDVWRIFIDARTGEYVRKDNMVLHCEFDTPHDAFHSIVPNSAERINCPSALRSFAPSLIVDGGVGFIPALTSSQPMPSLVPDSSYTVFAMPVESPNHGTRSVEVRPWTATGSSNDATTLGWHSTGTTNYTITRGNNVHAYEDIDNNGSPGFSPDTANFRFDYPFDPQLHPEDNMAAAVTNLFYWNNTIHDVMYQYGFDEVSGNFQVNNLGRGGQGNDDVRAEALDGGGLNNANFFTPVDGSRPRMQMYLWSSVSEDSPLTINSPESISGDMYAVESAFSNNNLLEEIGLTTGDLVLVVDEGDTTHLACGTISNGDSLDGKIAVIDRGECNFTVKVKNAQNAGAIAAIVINNLPGYPFGMGGTDNTIVIPAVMISLSDGNLLKAVMDTTIVNVSLDAVDGIIPDGDYDSGIITHEYGHGISIRLTGGPSNVSCLNNDEQMGEGWSDYFGLMLTTDWDNASATDLRGIGTYVYGQPTDGTGIRTYPYTTDMLANPFTYASIEDSGGSVHYVGSVWCTMLWDMTWKIIDIAGTDPDMYHGTGGNNIALQLVMDALKLQPCNPGFIDGRDAILLADQIRYGGQYSCAIWEAFAARGLGVDASQGSSDNYLDGVESFDIPTGVYLESAANVSEAGDGQEVTFILKTKGGCEGKSDLEIRDVLSDDLIYIPGSGGMLDSNTVVFTADTLGPLDSLVFSYRAIVPPCSASYPVIISEDDAEGPDQFESIKLGGSGTKQWVKSSALSVSQPNSWYGRDYSTYSDYVLTLIEPLEIDGPVEIAFDHRYQTEATYDGGVVEYSLNGTTWLDAGPYFIQNGYPSAITNTNSAITGRDAFTGNSNTQFNTTGFIHSTIRLNLAASQTFHVRFRFASDGNVGGPGINGWYIDNIVINQLSGVTNHTRVTAGDVLEDSLIYTLRTKPFDGEVLFVDTSATGDGSGISWEHAMPDLLRALVIIGCRTTDSLFVAEGIFLPNQTNDRELSFQFPDSTLVFGGFPSGGSAFAERDPMQYITVFSGDIGLVNDNADNVYHVVKIDSAQQGITLDGITLSHGNANGVGDSAQGAAVFCEGELNLRNVTISHHHGLSDGQLILIREALAHLLLDDCTIYSPEDSSVKLLNTNSGQVTVIGNTVFLKE